jgi:hypothetical protein
MGLVPFVWDGDAGFFGVDCCVGVVCWVAEVRAGQGLEEGRLADIGETDNPRLPKSMLAAKKDMRGGQGRRREKGGGEKFFRGVCSP